MIKYINKEKTLHDAAQLRQDVMSLVRRLRQHSEGGALPVAQMLLLSRVQRLADQACPSTLAAQEGLRPQNLSALLTTLETQGYILREQNSTDKRRVVVRLTRQGEFVLEQDRARREQWLASAMAHSLDETELKILRQAGELMQRLAQWDDPSAD